MISKQVRLLLALQALALLVYGIPTLAFANDTRADADDFDLNDTLFYTIDPIDDADWLRIEVTQAGTLRIWTTGNTDVIGGLTDNNGNFLVIDDDSGTGLNFEIVRDVSPGTYYLLVEGFETGPYDLHSEFTPDSGLPHANDANGWWTDADNLDINSSLDYSIDPITDVDWLRIDVPSDGVLEVWTTGNTDTYALLIDSNQNILADDDDDGSGLNFYIEVDVRAGTYYVAVEGFDTGPYTIRSEFTPDSGLPRANDANGWWTSADGLDINSSLDYSIDPITDVDWLRIDVPSDGMLKVWTTGNTDTYALLIDSNQNILADDDDDGSGLNFHIEVDVDAGTYYVAVEGFNTGPYTIRSEFTPDDPGGDDDTVISGVLPRSPDPTDSNGWWTNAVTFALNHSDDNWAINPANDVDWIRLVVPSNGLLEVWTTGNTDTYALLTDSNQNILAEDDDSGGTGLNFHIETDVRAGTHYVAIQAFGTGPYTIHSRFTERSASDADVNNDGVVDVDDLVLVATHFGTTNAQADINNDGIVDREDILIVLAELEAEAANGTGPVPGSPLHTAKTSTAESLQQWIDRAKLRNNPDVAFQNGIGVLEELLATLLEQEMTPLETALLPNYPNPFNPETWIPYHLSGSADVTLTIYAADGRVVRTLAIGHQLPGVYKSRGRAAYWDGRNASGEPVASGIYFYTLTAGDFAATRKMLIMK